MLRVNLIAVVSIVVLASPFRASAVEIMPRAAWFESPISITADEEWGLKLTEVRADGAAAKAGMLVGDIILSVGGMRVESFDELVAALNNAVGPTKLVFINCENRQIEKMMITPLNGKIGVTAEPVVIE